jgi:hypothetical protein
MHAQDHSDWHRLARAEGVNAWDCPFDCTDYPEEDQGPPVFASVFNPNLGGEYPVFSANQLAAYAETLAIRLGVPVQVRMADDTIRMVEAPPEPEYVECPHGLSADLCQDPFNHYGPDQY